jgi:hypothetical protein
MSIDPKNVVFVVYDPPKPGFPYLSVIFFPGREEPMTTQFDTAATAEAFNRQVAAKFATQGT